MISVFCQLEMSGRQTGGGTGVDELILRTVWEICPYASRKNFHFAVHKFIGDAFDIFDF